MTSDINLSSEEMEQLLNRLESQSLESVDYSILVKMVLTLVNISDKLEAKELTIARLKKIFGIKTEKLKSLVQAAELLESSAENNPELPPPPAEEPPPKKKTRKQKRNSAADYKKAKVTKISHQTLKAGDLCSGCGKGHLRIINPARAVRIVGQPWLQAEVYEQERLRCNRCSKIFTASLPKDVATASKYDKSAKAVVALLKYRGGFAFYRQEQLQKMLETPVSDTQMWEMTRDIAECLRPVHQTMIQEAAKGKCLHNDDTKARVLDLMKENKDRRANDNGERVGIFTSVILSILESKKQIALFFTGRQHAGENLNDVLEERPAGMDIPIQMCDASSQNRPADHKTSESNCNSHLRRKFFELVHLFPEFILPILGWFAEIFHTDKQCKERHLDDQARLEWHIEKSKPLMDKIKAHCDALLEKKEVEPNSSFGKAIAYLNNHWPGFTLFLRQPGVPLCNNAGERVVKQAVLNRKNGYFFKSEYGAWVGDVLLSVIETCQLNGINPYDYLIAVQTYKQDAMDNPSQWLPWDYQERIKTLTASQERDVLISPAITVSS